MRICFASGGRKKYIALSGGVGGAKLCLGLAHILNPEEVAFVVNTGDDFEHLGFHISPDADTLLYTLAGLNNPVTGWGRVAETWQFIEAFEQLGGEAWFRLGDQDLAIHVMRTGMLRAGQTLAEVIGYLRARLDVRHPILPMSNDPVRTLVATQQGALSFQHYFVRERCEPAVTGFSFAGSAEAELTPAISAYLRDPDLAGVIICPSNPYVSIDPILATGECRALLSQCAAPVVAISPIVGGEAIKGPTAKMMRELDIPSSATLVAKHYQDILDGYIIDQQDAALSSEIISLGIPTTVSPTVMVTLADRCELARTAIEFISRLHRNV